MKRIAFLFVLLSACSNDLEPEKAFRVYVYRDELTGCEYLSTGGSSGGMVPRLDRDGKQICRTTERSAK